jgi:hypothetical protein
MEGERVRRVQLRADYDCSVVRFRAVNVACQSQGAKQVIFGTMHPRGYRVCLHRSLDSGGRIIHLAVGESKL